MSLLKSLAACIAFALCLSASPVPVKTKTSTHRTPTAARTSGLALLRPLSLHDRIAQLIVVRAYGDYPPTEDPEYKKLTRWIRDDHVGGFIVANRVRYGSVINAQSFEMVSFINHLQRIAKTPLLVASDFEHGASMRVAGTAKYPYFMAFGAAHDLTAVRALGADTAQEAHALGVNWVFAPDADVNNNPDNPIINVRSYGENPQAVAGAVSAFIEGAHSDPRDYVLVTAKHFPGHGDTAEDSHMQMAKLDQPKERIESVELVPFRAAIEHGVDAVMTAHMSVPAFEPSGVPSTVSRNVLTNLLRDELGFKGLVVTDAMDMQGLAALYSQGDAAVRAIEAGADVLLMPSDPEACIRALMAAVKSGRISRRRIDESAAKIMEAKRRVGLFRSRFTSVDQIPDSLDSPDFPKLAQSVADHAVTLVKDDQHLFPMPAPADGACLVIMSEGLFSQRGETLVRILQQRVPQLKTYITHPTTPVDELTAIATATGQCKQIYVAAFVTVAAYRGSVGLEGGLSAFMNALVHSPVPVALISLGNPYLLRDYSNVAAYAATFSTTVTSEEATAKAMLGDIPITGKLPVSIPGIAKPGDGIDVPAKSTKVAMR